MKNSEQMETIDEEPETVAKTWSNPTNVNGLFCAAAAQEAEDRENHLSAQVASGATTEPITPPSSPSYFGVRGRERMAGGLSIQPVFKPSFRPGVTGTVQEFYSRVM